MTTLLRYSDLEKRGIVRNRATLRRWIQKEGFPSGTMLGPNTKVWTEEEIAAYIAERQRRAG
jgi:predicted DNA-binding transcriptional regulator AlpA